MDDLFDAEEQFTLAKLDLKKGEVALGLSRLKKALRLPDCPLQAFVETARVYAQLGLRKKALPLFQQYLEQAPGDIDARFQIGMIWFEEGQPGEALPIWNNLLQEAPLYPPALYFRAAAVSGLGNIAEARNLLRSAMEVLPTDNLYFARSRELLSSLDSGIASSASLLTTEQTYKTQH